MFKSALQTRISLWTENKRENVPDTYLRMRWIFSILGILVDSGGNWLWNRMLMATNVFLFDFKPIRSISKRLDCISSDFGPNPGRARRCLKYRLEIKNPVRAWDNIPLWIVFFYGKQVPIRFRSVYTNEKGKVRASRTLVGRRIESFLIIFLAESWNRKFESEWVEPRKRDQNWVSSDAEFSAPV